MSKTNRGTESYKRWKLNYYRRHQYHPEGHKKHGPKFEPSENRLILLHNLKDVILAKRLQRSVESIQIKRSRLNKLIRNESLPIETRCSMVWFTTRELNKLLSQK